MRMSHQNVKKELAMCHCLDRATGITLPTGNKTYELLLCNYTGTGITFCTSSSKASCLDFMVSSSVNGQHAVVVSL